MLEVFRTFYSDHFQPTCYGRALFENVGKYDLLTFMLGFYWLDIIHEIEYMIPIIILLCKLLIIHIL